MPIYAQLLVRQHIEVMDTQPVLPRQSVKMQMYVNFEEPIWALNLCLQN
jgi:hypothetical protein